MAKRLLCSTSFFHLHMKNCCYFLALALLSGCITILPTFKTNTDYESLHRFKRILVVSKLPKVPQAYLDAWIISFPDQYDVCVVDASELTFGNPDSLITQKARECQSEAILTLDYDRSYTVGSGKYISSVSEFFLQMAFMPDRKPFWKALTGDTAPRHIVQQLVTDAIIEGQVPRAIY